MQWTPLARADAYKVAVDCNTATNAWTADRSPGMDAYNTCGGTNIMGIVARVGVTSNPNATVPYGSYSEWRFTAPPGTSVIFGELTGQWRAQTSGWQTGTWGTGTSPLVACFASCQTTDAESFAPPNVNQIWFRAACYRADGCLRSSNGQPAGVVALNNATLTLQDNYPAAIISPDADNLDGRWLSDSAQLPFYAADIGSGVKRVELWTQYGGALSDARDLPCDSSRPAPCPREVASDTTGPLRLNVRDLNDGTFTGILRAIDYSGAYSDHNFTYHVDATAAAAPREIKLIGPAGWRRENGFRLHWVNPDRAGGAPVVAAHYSLCPAANEDSADCVTGRTAGLDIDHVDGLRLPHTGEWKARVWLEDAAGNKSERQRSDPVLLRFDDQPPSPNAFEPLDPSDPQRLEVRVSDDASGVADGQIELARQGSDTWQRLSTRMVAGRLRARVDDSRMADGVYRLQAIAVDVAGNTSIGSQRLDGGPAQLTSPVRISSRLAAGFLRVRHTGRRGHRRTVIRLMPRLRTRYRRHTRIHGRLLTPDGQPLVGQRVIVTSQTTAINSKPQVKGVVETDRRGRYSYTTIARTSRTLTFQYAGDDIIRPTARRVRLVVPARSTIHLNRHAVVNGQSVTFWGRLRGGHIPRGGKPIQLVYFTQGVGWRLFAWPIRADRHGRWRITYPIQGVRGHIRYALRLSIESEAAYPFATGHSATRHLVVRGL